MVQYRDAYNGRPTVSRIMIYRTALYSATLKDPYPRLPVRAIILMLKISETVRDTDIL